MFGAALVATLLTTPALAWPQRIEVHDGSDDYLGDRLQELERGCDEPGGKFRCANLLNLRAGQAFALLSGDDSLRPAPTERPALRCTADVIGCLTRRFGVGVWFIERDEAVWLAPTDGSKVRAIWVKQPGIGALRNTFVVPRVIYRDLVVDAPELVAAMRASPLTQAAGGFQYERPGLEFVDDLGRLSSTGAVDRFVWGTPLTEPAWVVCADRVARVNPTDLFEVRAHYYGLPDVVGKMYSYRLPCPAQIVVGGAVHGLAVGPLQSATGWTTSEALQDGRVSKSAGGITFRGRAPSTEGEWWTECEVVAGEHRVARQLRGCAVPFVGDLNGDGTPDAVVMIAGSMGCISTALLVSEGSKWAVAAHQWNVC